MVSHSRVIFSDEVSKYDVAAHWVPKTGYMLNKGIYYRKSNQNNRKFIDIQYHEFINDSLEVMKGIYDHSGGMDEILEKRILQADKDNPQGKYGIHEYSLADFGLTEEDIRKQTSNYQEFFNGKQEEQPIQQPFSGNI
jgi:hypothetical protein